MVTPLQETAIPSADSLPVGHLAEIQARTNLIRRRRIHFVAHRSDPILDRGITNPTVWAILAYRDRHVVAQRVDVQALVQIRRHIDQIPDLANRPGCIPCENLREFPRHARLQILPHDDGMGDTPWLHVRVYNCLLYTSPSPRD